MPPIITEETRAAYGIALELAKQLITLSTGLLALSITFTKDLLKAVPRLASVVLGAAWVCLFLSILHGIRNIGGLTSGLIATGTKSATTGGVEWARGVADRLERGDSIDPYVLAEAGIYINPSAQHYAILQDRYFRIGLMLLIAYGIIAVICRAISGTPDETRQGSR